MPITGEFIADFADFVRGAKEAETAIGGIETKSNDLGTSFQQAFASFDLKKLLANPIEESSSLLSTLASNMDAGAASAIGLAATVAPLAGVLLEMAASTAKSDEALGSLAEKTGIAVASMSRLQNQATVAGTTIESVTSIITAMQKRMAVAPDTFEKGLKAIGVAWSDFAALDPAAQLDALTTGIKGLNGPVEKARVETELFGGAWKTAAGTLDDLAAAKDKVGNMRIVTAEDVAAAKEFETNWRAISGWLKGIGGEIGTTAARVVNDLVRDMGHLGESRGAKLLGDTFGFLDSKLGLVSASLDLASGKTREAMPAIQGLNEHTTTYTASVAALAATTPTLTAALGHQTEITRDQKEFQRQVNEEVRAAEEAHKRYAAAMVELNAAGVGWRGTIDGINGAVVEAVKYYLDAGVSQGALATAYGLTAGQVRAVSEAMREEQTTARETQRITAAAVEAEIKAWQAYDTAVQAGSADTTQKQIDAVWRAADQQILALAKVGTLTASTYAAITATANQSSDNIIAKTLQADVSTKAHYDQLAAQAGAAFDFAMTHADQYTTERLMQLRSEADAAKLTLADWQTAADAALTKVKGAAEQAAGAIKKVNDETKAATVTMNSFAGTMLPTPDSLRALAETPGSLLGLGIPGPSPLGYSISGLDAKPPIVNNNITINGSVLSNKDEIARVVGDALVSSYRAGGNRTPV